MQESIPKMTDIESLIYNGVLVGSYYSAENDNSQKGDGWTNVTKRWRCRLNVLTLLGGRLEHYLIITTCLQRWYGWCFVQPFGMTYEHGLYLGVPPIPSNRHQMKATGVSGHYYCEWDSRMHMLRQVYWFSPLCISFCYNGVMIFSMKGEDMKGKDEITWYVKETREVAITFRDERCKSPLWSGLVGINSQSN